MPKSFIDGNFAPWSDLLSSSGDNYALIPEGGALVPLTAAISCLPMNGITKPCFQQLALLSQTGSAMIRVCLQLVLTVQVYTRAQSY